MYLITYLYISHGIEKYRMAAVKCPVGFILSNPGYILINTLQITEEQAIELARKGT